MFFTSSPGGTTTVDARRVASRSAASLADEPFFTPEVPDRSRPLPFKSMTDSLIQSYNKMNVRRCSQWKPEDLKRTYVYTDEPASTMTATHRLFSTRVDLEMHIKVVLHFLLTSRSVSKPDCALLTLDRKVLVKTGNSLRTLSIYGNKMSQKFETVTTCTYLEISDVERRIFIDNIRFAYIF